ARRQDVRRKLTEDRSAHLREAHQQGDDEVARRLRRLENQVAPAARWAAVDLAESLPGQQGRRAVEPKPGSETWLGDVLPGDETDSRGCHRGQLELAHVFLYRGVQLLRVQWLWIAAAE